MLEKIGVAANTRAF